MVFVPEARSPKRLVLNPYIVIEQRTKSAWNSA